MNKEELQEIADQSNFKWIKVKKFEFDSDMGPAGQELNELRKHHKQETEFLINKCRKLALELLKQSKNELTLDYVKSLIRDENDYIGIDFDATLAHRKSGDSNRVLGEPIPQMLERVKSYVNNNIRVKIFTARAAHTGKALVSQLYLLRNWMHKYGLPELEISNVKCDKLRLLIDDKACRCEKNTGNIIFNFPNNQKN